MCKYKHAEDETVVGQPHQFSYKGHRENISRDRQHGANNRFFHSKVTFSQLLLIVKQFQHCIRTPPMYNSSGTLEPSGNTCKR